MHIRELDARTAPDADLLAIVAIEQACSLPGDPGRSTEEAIGFLRNQPPTHETYNWLADGGSASLYIHGPKATFVHLHVHPDARRQGIGRALAEHVLQRARERGCEDVHAHYATEEGRAFARALGARDGQRQVMSAVYFDGVHLSDPVLPEGWRLITWLARVPDEHLDAYVRARKSMDDAPGSDEIDYPTATAERVRAAEATLAARGREVRVTVAMRDDGVVGAFTELRWSPGSTAALTDDTGTVAEFRGLGLAKAVKLESLRRLHADRPAVVAVKTNNAEENAAMRHINETVGFRPFATFTQATVSL